MRQTAPGPCWWLPRLLALVAVALWARLAIWAQVFVGDAVLPRYPDAYYHLRRILRSVESFPRVPVLDPLLNWPDGGASPWPPGFDWMGAALALALGAGDDPGRAAHVAAFLPVLLGLAALAVVMGVAYRLAWRRGDGERGAQVALVAGLVFALMPSSVIVSRLGRLDHHVGEVLAMALLGAWALWACRLQDASGWRRRDALAFEAAGALIALWAGLVFSGSVLYVAVAAGLLVALQLARPGPAAHALLGTGAPALGVAALLLAGFAVPAVAAHGRPFDFRFQSQFQPALYAVAALGCLAAAQLSRLCAFAPGPTRLLGRASAGALLLGAGLLLALLLAPEISREVLRGLRDFVARRDAWLSRIDEFQPLIRSAAIWRFQTWSLVYEVHGVLGLLAAPLLLLGCGLALRADRSAGAVFAGWTAAVLCLALLQLRFGRLLTVNLAICTAFVCVWLGRRMARRARGVRPLWIACALVALCALLDPLSRERLAWQPPRAVSPLESAAFYLREVGTTASPRPGVLAPWDWGHTLLALGGRPVVSAGFGPWVGPEGFAEVEMSLAGSEDALIELMDRRRLGWLATGRTAFEEHVVPTARARAPVVWRGGVAALERDYFRAVPLAALMLGGGGDAREGIRHVSRLMPRFVSRARDPVNGAPIFRLWLFERVPGAKIEGRAAPGTRVIARTELVPHGIALTWEAWADADADGVFRIRVPLPNDLRTASLSSGPHYEVWIDGTRRATLAIGEEDVRSGRAIRLAEQVPGADSVARSPGDVGPETGGARSLERAPGNPSRN